MKIICSICGQPLDSENTKCPSCGEYNASEYPVEKRLHIGAAALLFSSLFLVNMVYSQIKAGPIVRDTFLTVMLIIIILAVWFVGIAFLFQKVYVLDCPVCGSKLEFPVKAEHCECEACHNTLINKDGVIQRLDTKD